jgi:adenosylhomocysteine nucleosidase
LKSRVAIVAAMAREIDPLVRGWKREASAEGVTVFSSENAVAVFAGMGQERAELAAQTALSFGPVHRLISAGWAGGIHPGMTIGAVRFASVVVDAVTGERFAADREDASEAGLESAVVVTTDRVVSAADKRRLRVEIPADLVEMEAAGVARVAREHRIPLLVIKAVSDAYDFDLPAIGEFVSPSGGFREGAFAAYVALRPALWNSVLRLARDSATAARNLSGELERYLVRDRELATVRG